MGDFRFSMTIKFQMGDVKDKCDFWLNYTPRDEIVDYRVLEWLEDAFDRGERSVRDNLSEHFQHIEDQKERIREDEILKKAEDIQNRRNSEA